MADDLRPWLAHEHPDRPFDTWTWIDDCPECLERRSLCRWEEQQRALVAPARRGQGISRVDDATDG